MQAACIWVIPVNKPRIMMYYFDAGIGNIDTITQDTNVSRLIQKIIRKSHTSETLMVTKQLATDF